MSRCPNCGSLMLFDIEEQDYVCTACSRPLKYQLEPRPQEQPTRGREPGVAGIGEPYKWHGRRTKYDRR